MKILKKFNKIFFNLLGYQISRKTDEDDFYLHKYNSYKKYKDTQILHNIRKINKVWADQHTMNRVALLVKEQKTRKNTKKKLGLCHGTRNGYEQNYLNSLNMGIFAIGTDISPACSKFLNTFVWDFHKHNKNWINRFDFVYTNSLDQSWNPKKAIEVWLGQIKKDGQIIIEHTKSHGPEEAGEMDPFGVRPSVFPYILTMWFGHKITISHSVEKKYKSNLDAWLFVIKKTNNTIIVKKMRNKRKNDH
jgi:hypothetical protein